MTLRERLNDLIASLDQGPIEERKHKIMRWVAEITTADRIPNDIFSDAPQEVLQIMLFSFTTQILKEIGEESNGLHRHAYGDRPLTDHPQTEMPEV